MATDPRHTLSRLRRVSDPAERLRRLAAASAALDAELRALKADTVRELREAGWTLEEIGAVLGVTGQRVGQLSRL